MHRPQILPSRIQYDRFVGPFTFPVAKVGLLSRVDVFIVGDPYWLAMLAMADLGIGVSPPS